MYPKLPDIKFEENAERLKIVMPVQRNQLFFAVYGLLLLVGLALLVGGIVFGVEIAFSGERYAFVFTVMALIFLYILWRFTGFIWSQWQFHAANRELLFVNKEEMIVRRPLSLLGITKVYDRQYIKTIYFDAERSAAAFYYGSQPAFFGEGLPSATLHGLIAYLNERYFSQYDLDDDDDEL